LELLALLGVQLEHSYLWFWSSRCKELHACCSRKRLATTPATPLPPRLLAAIVTR